MEQFIEMFNNTSKDVMGFFPKVLLAIVVFVVTYFIAKVVKKLSLEFYSKIFKKSIDIAKLISKVFYYIILLIGVFLTLEILGLGSFLSKMLAGAGVLGIVVGFAFKEIASNLISGIIISAHRPFKTDDLVDIEGNFGKVKDIGIITTSIQTLDGQEVFVPNNLVYQNTFTNYSTFNKRRVVLKSGVSYGDDLKHVKEVAIDEVKKIDLVLENEAIDFYFTDIGSSTYNFELRFWIEFKKQTDYLEAMSELVVRIKERFEKEDISIAYSVTTLDFAVKGGTNIFDKAITVNTTQK